MSFYESTLYNALPVTIILSGSVLSKKIEISLLLNGDSHSQLNPKDREGFSISIIAEQVSYHCRLGPPDLGNQFDLSNLPQYLPQGVYKLLAGVSGGYCTSGVNLIEHFTSAPGKGRFIKLGSDEKCFLDEAHEKLQILVACSSEGHMGQADFPFVAHSLGIRGTMTKRHIHALKAKKG